MAAFVQLICAAVCLCRRCKASQASDGTTWPSAIKQSSDFQVYFAFDAGVFAANI